MIASLVFGLVGLHVSLVAAGFDDFEFTPRAVHQAPPHYGRTRQHFDLRQAKSKADKLGTRET